MPSNSNQIAVCLNPRLLSIELIKLTLRQAKPHLRTLAPKSKAGDWYEMVAEFEERGQFTLWVYALDESSFGPTLLLTPKNVEPQLSLTISWQDVICMTTGTELKLYGFSQIAETSPKLRSGMEE